MPGSIFIAGNMMSSCLQGVYCPGMKIGLKYCRKFLLTGPLSSLTPEGGTHGCLCKWVIHCHINILIVIHFFSLQKYITFEGNNGSNYLSTQEEESNSIVINKIAQYPCSRLSYSYGIQESRDWSQAVWGHQCINQQTWGTLQGRVSSVAWGTCCQGLQEVILPAVRKDIKAQQCDRKTKANLGV